MATTVNNNNIESNNGMSQVVIDLRPQVKHQDGHGREVLADVHFRIDVQAYTANLYTYTKEAREESEKACEAYYSEVVELLKAEGWTLRKEKFGVGDCPQMVKGTQYLYCHPQDISGEVDPADIETLEAKIKTLTTCKYYATDNYGDIIVTTSESDEKHLYRDTYADGLASIWQECTTTKRSNLYKDKAEAEHCVRRRICIANRRADLNDIGTGSYNMRTPLLQFLMEEYDRLLQAGYIKEAEGRNGRTLCRWINKKEEKELNKARREAEKAEKERKAATLEPASEITEQREQNDACISSAESRRDKANGQITEAEGVKVGDKVRHNKHEEVATVTAIREAFVNRCDGYRYLYTLDFGQSVLGPFQVELNGGEFLREAFTLIPDYYSEYQKLGHQEARPQEWLKNTTNEKRATYYRACVELERMAGDGLPLVIRADGADAEANPWNALEKRVKTARVFHLGDRVKMHYPYQCNEVTGVINRIRFDDGTVIVIYGEYRTPLKGMVKYQPEMDDKAA